MGKCRFTFFVESFRDRISSVMFVCREWELFEYSPGGMFLGDHVVWVIDMTEFLAPVSGALTDIMVYVILMIYLVMAQGEKCMHARALQVKVHSSTLDALKLSGVFHFVFR